MSICSKAELVRDYAFDELGMAERAALERHLAECGECARELDQLRLTTAALRVLPDREPPRKIAFVSDQVFAPSRFRSFVPWLGFASTAIMAIAMVVSAERRPVEVRTVMTPSPSLSVASTTTPQNVDETVKRAVAEVRREDARIFKAALVESEQRHDREHSNLIDAISVLQAHLNTGAIQSEAGGGSQ